MLLRTLISRELVLVGVRSLYRHKLRSSLTALGMIFGVGAVICMLSIGEGASAEQLASIRLLGSQNIILRSIEPPASNEARQQDTTMKEYGLKRVDIERLATLPHVRDVVKMREVADQVARGARKFEARVLGTSENLFSVVNLPIARGRPLCVEDILTMQKVCVIGHEVAETLFPAQDPLGQHVSVYSRATGAVPYEVVGVMANLGVASGSQRGGGGGAAVRNPNRDVFLPLSTVDLRYGAIRAKFGRGTRDIRKVEFSDAILAIDEQDNVLAASKLARRVLEHGHKDADYAMTVPLELLREAERSKRLWQSVLGSIAGISLLVGGIGIMNIMLASVTERTREIGIRRALGAKRYQITAQFLIETLILSVSGGVIGIVVGVTFARVVSMFTSFDTIVPLWGVVLAFVVSAVIGVSFGLYPARAAARLDPIEALRHE